MDINKLFQILGDNHFFKDLDVLNKEDIEKKLGNLEIKDEVKQRILEIYSKISPTVYDFYEAFIEIYFNDEIQKFGKEIHLDEDPNFLKNEAFGFCENFSL